MKKLLLLGLLGLMCSCGPSKYELDRKAELKADYPFLNSKEITLLYNHEDCSLKDCAFSEEIRIINKKIEDNKKQSFDNKTEQIVNSMTPQSNVNKFSSIETGLPIGTIIYKDCSNCTDGNIDKIDIKNNYVTIKKLDGFNVIIKDIDEDLYLNLKPGDIIE